MSRSGASQSSFLAIPAGVTLTTGEGALTTAGLFNGGLQVGPVYLSRKTTFTGLGAHIKVAGQAGSTVTAAVYGNGAGYQPGALLAQSAALDGTVVGVAVTAVGFTLQPGVYWMGTLCLGAPVTPPQLAFNVGTPNRPFGDLTITSPTDLNAYTFAQVGLAALPANMAGTLNQQNYPVIALRT